VPLLYSFKNSKLAIFRGAGADYSTPGRGSLDGFSSGPGVDQTGSRQAQVLTSPIGVLVTAVEPGKSE